MSDSNDLQKQQQKADKKQAKAELKRLKKDSKLPEGSSTSSASDSPQSTQPTPAERSAAAAERQVRLQRWRVAIGLAMLLIALITFLWKTDAGRLFMGLSQSQGNAVEDAPGQ